MAFDGLTEDWRLTGQMMIEGRLSDALNKREPIELLTVQWGPVDGSEPMVDAPGLKTVDPYDLVIVVAGDDSIPEMSEDGRAAHRVHKVSYEVAIEVPPYRVIGTVYLHPGSEPDSLLSRSSEMFVPIVEATAMMGDTPRRTGDGVGGPRQSPVHPRRRTGRRADGRAPPEATRRLDGRDQLDRSGSLTIRFR